MIWLLLIPVVLYALYRAFGWYLDYIEPPYFDEQGMFTSGEEADEEEWEFREVFDRLQKR